jgi:hypothetical protein
MRLESAFEINGFSGINNVSDAARVPPSSGVMPLKEAVNVDIDDSTMISRSKGFDLVYPGNFHSQWSPKKKDFALCIQDGTLKKLTWLDGALTVTSIYAGLDPAARMQYVEADDRIFMTNGSFIGYFREDLLLDLNDIEPAQTFKTRMPAGHLIEFYDNQLYVAVDRVIYYSDAGAWHRTDLRRNFLPFTGRVRMIQAVTDGLFVSDDNGIYFLAGGTAKELVLKPKSTKPVFPGGFQKVDGEMMGTKDPISGEVILMLNADGIFLGGNEGMFFNLTKNRYKPSGMGEVSTLVRIDPDTHQVIFTGAVFTPEQSGELELRLPTLTMDFRG